MSENTDGDVKLIQASGIRCNDTSLDGGAVTKPTERDIVCKDLSKNDEEDVKSKQTSLYPERFGEECQNEDCHIIAVEDPCEGKASYSKNANISNKSPSHYEQPRENVIQNDCISSKDENKRGRGNGDYLSNPNDASTFSSSSCQNSKTETPHGQINTEVINICHKDGKFGESDFGDHQNEGKDKTGTYLNQEICLIDKVYSEVHQNDVEHVISRCEISKSEKALPRSVKGHLKPLNEDLKAKLVNTMSLPSRSHIQSSTHDSLKTNTQGLLLNDRKNVCVNEESAKPPHTNEDGYLDDKRNHKNSESEDKNRTGNATKKASLESVISRCKKKVSIDSIFNREISQTPSQSPTIHGHSFSSENSTKRHNETDLDTKSIDSFSSADSHIKKVNDVINLERSKNEPVKTGSTEIDENESRPVGGANNGNSHIITSAHLESIQQSHLTRENSHDLDSPIANSDTNAIRSSKHKAIFIDEESNKNGFCFPETTNINNEGFKTRQQDEIDKMTKNRLSLSSGNNEEALGQSCHDPSSCRNRDFESIAEHASCSYKQRDKYDKSQVHTKVQSISEEKIGSSHPVISSVCSLVENGNSSHLFNDRSPIKNPNQKSSHSSVIEVQPIDSDSDFYQNHPSFCKEKEPSSVVDKGNQIQNISPRAKIRIEHMVKKKLKNVGGIMAVNIEPDNPAEENQNSVIQTLPSENSPKKTSEIQDKDRNPSKSIQEKKRKKEDDKKFLSFIKSLEEFKGKHALGFKSHDCDICVKGFTNPAALVRHITLIPNLPSCCLCIKGHTDEEKIRRHMKKHVSNTCRICSKVSYAHDLMRNHVRSHRRRGESSRMSFICRFNNHHKIVKKDPTRRYRHVEKDPEKLYKMLDTLGKGEDLVKYALANQQEQMSKDGRPTENETENSLNRSRAINRFQYSINKTLTNGRPSEKIFKKMNLERQYPHFYKKRVNNIKEKASSVFTQPSQKYRTFHNTKLKYARAKNYFNIHQVFSYKQSINGAKGPGTTYDCHVCGRVFKRLDYLTQHVASHTGYKPFKCSACTQGFFRPAQLVRHYVYKHAPSVETIPKLYFDKEKGYVTVSAADGTETEDQFYSFNLPSGKVGTNADVSTEDIGNSPTYPTLQSQLMSEHNTGNIQRKNSVESTNFCDACIVCGEDIIERPHVCKGQDKQTTAPGDMDVTSKPPNLETISIDLCESSDSEEPVETLPTDQPPIHDKYPCKFCRKEFGALASLKIHLATHISHQPTCHICGIVFQSDHDLQRHSDNVHKKELLTPEEDSIVNNSEKTDKDLDKLNLQSEIISSNKEGTSSDTLSALSLDSVLNSSVDSDTNLTETQKEASPFHCTRCTKVFKKREHFEKHNCVPNGPKPQVSPYDVSQGNNVAHDVTSMLQRVMGENENVSSKAQSDDLAMKLRDTVNYQQMNESFQMMPKIFQCPHCVNAFSDIYQFYSHLESHAIEYNNSIRHNLTSNPFLRCNKCLVDFNDFQSFEEHRIFHENHDEINQRLGRYQCFYCLKYFQNRSHFQEHLRSHTKERPYSCSFCPKTFAQSAGLRLHIRTHNGVKHHVCLRCGKSFDNETLLRVHKLEHESPVNPYNCGVCLAEFSSDIDLQRHHYTFHANVVSESSANTVPEKTKSPPTDSAEKYMDELISPENPPPSFAFLPPPFNLSMSEGLVGEMEETQSAYASTSAESPLAIQPQVGSINDIGQNKKKDILTRCIMCGELFSSFSDLEFHWKRAHPTEFSSYGSDKHSPIQSQDSEKYSSKKSLIESKSIEIPQNENEGDNEQFKCQQCTASYDNIDDLKAHEVNHVRKKNYKCDMCDEVFIRPLFLKQHRLSHFMPDRDTPPPNKSQKMEGEIKKYVCLDCPQEFLNFIDLLVHAQIHSDYKIFQCVRCGKTFPTDQKYRKHNRTHSHEKRMRCEKCDNEYDTAVMLKLHICDKSIRYPPSPTIGIDGRIRQFACCLCDAKFIFKNHLLDHFALHTSMRSHNCTICGHGFMRPAPLRKHVASHMKLRKKALVSLSTGSRFRTQAQVRKVVNEESMDLFSNQDADYESLNFSGTYDDYNFDMSGEGSFLGGSQDTDQWGGFKDMEDDQPRTSHFTGTNCFEGGSYEQVFPEAQPEDKQGTSEFLGENKEKGKKSFELDEDTRDQYQRRKENNDSGKHKNKHKVKGGSKISTGKKTFDLSKVKKEKIDDTEENYVVNSVLGDVGDTSLISGSNDLSFESVKKEPGLDRRHKDTFSAFKGSENDEDDEPDVKCIKEVYVCSICDETFDSDRSLRKHTREGHEERPSGIARNSTHICQYCEKPFVSAQGLRIHLMLHTGEKPHECELCETKFRLKKQLEIHLERFHRLKTKSKRKRRISR